MIKNSMTDDEVYHYLRTLKYLNKEAKAYVKWDIGISI